MCEIKKDGFYQVVEDSGEIILTIIALGNNIYKAVNKFTMITAEIIPLDDYRTSLMCIENRKADKNGRYRKSKTLAEENVSWLNYMLQEKGFIRKAKPMK